jgi:hypothetical protein
MPEGPARLEARETCGRVGALHGALYGVLYGVLTPVTCVVALGPVLLTVHTCTASPFR